MTMNVDIAPEKVERLLTITSFHIIASSASE